MNGLDCTSHIGTLLFANTPEKVFVVTDVWMLEAAVFVVFVCQSVQTLQALMMWSTKTGWWVFVAALVIATLEAAVLVTVIFNTVVKAVT